MQQSKQIILDSEHLNKLTQSYQKGKKMHQRQYEIDTNIEIWFANLRSKEFTFERFRDELATMLLTFKDISELYDMAETLNSLFFPNNNFRDTEDKE